MSSEELTITPGGHTASDPCFPPSSVIVTGLFFVPGAGGVFTSSSSTPLQPKRLIRHAAGLWRLTATKSASREPATHTGTALIGCLTPGGTPLIVCLAYSLPHCDCPNTLVCSPHSTRQRQEAEVVVFCRDHRAIAAFVCVSVCVCVCVRVRVCVCVSACVCM